MVPVGRGNFGGGSGGGGYGGNGNANFLVGQQSGISKTNSVGLNYSDNWGPKIKVTSSYFFNNSNNSLQQYIYQRYFNNDRVYINDTSSTRNYNHRFNLRLEYTIDSMNTLILVPKLSFQTNNSTDTTNKSDFRAGNTEQFNIIQMPMDITCQTI